MAEMLTVGGQPLPPYYGSTAPYQPYDYGIPTTGTGPYTSESGYPTAPYAGTTPSVAPPPPTTTVDTQTVNQPPPSGSPFGGYSNPDWASMIGGSWEVAQAEAMMAQQMARARDAFTGDLRQAFIDLGYTGDQSKLGNLSQYLNQDTIQSAINNKYSQYQQIADQATRANAVNNATLAARGILSSGQTAKSASDVLSSSEQARYTALRNFLQQGSSGLTHIGDVEAQLAQGVMNARFAAAQRLANMFQPYPLQPPAPGGTTTTTTTGGGDTGYVPPTWIQMGDQGYVPVVDTETGELTPWLNTGWLGIKDYA